jgi:hypothetical protein
VRNGGGASQGRIELSLKRPQGRNTPHFISGFNRAEKASYHNLRDLPGAFQTKADNSISLRRFDIRSGVSRRRTSPGTRGPESALAGMARDLAPVRRARSRPTPPSQRHHHFAPAGRTPNDDRISHWDEIVWRRTQRRAAQPRSREPVGKQRHTTESDYRPSRQQMDSAC